MTITKRYELLVEGNGGVDDVWANGKWWSSVDVYDSLEAAVEGRERDRHYWGDSDPLDKGYYRIDPIIDYSE